MSDVKIYNGSDINNNYTQSATVQRQKQTRGKIRTIVSFFALALVLVASSLTALALPPNYNMEMGIVTGGIYSKLSAPAPLELKQPLLDNADEIFSEFRGLGGEWIRIEANWARNYDPQYTFIADKAHAYGLKVIVLLTVGKQGPFCKYTGYRDNWFNDYVAELNRLSTDVFVNRNMLNAQADAYEIMNEPNQFGAAAPECENPNVFRMDGDSFAWLLRFVWRWKVNNNRPEKIISGGTINTYYGESWWNGFFNSTALEPGYGARPFDYFAVHPYNVFSGANYKAQTMSELNYIASRINSETGATNTRIFVTEFGAVGTTAGTAPAWMQTAFEAFRDSGVVDAALWYDYRDDSSEAMGLRSVWDANLNRYPAKSLVWAKFKALAGGTGSDDPEYYWQSWTLPNRTPYGFLDYANTTSIGGWAYDPDTVSPINVAIYIDGLYAGTTLANIQRWDLFPAGVAPNAAHGYTFPTPYLSPGCHSVAAVAMNYRGGANPQLPSPKQVCK